MAKFWNKIQKIVDEVETLETLSSEKRKKERYIYIYILFQKRNGRINNNFPNLYHTPIETNHCEFRFDELDPFPVKTIDSSANNGSSSPPLSRGDPVSALFSLRNPRNG